MARPTIDEYFLQMAALTATRATCDRKHVGAVIVKDKRTVSTGYNGSPKGMPHCDEAGHLLKVVDGRESCIRTLHAESNALDDAGRRAEGGTLYCTVTPCYECAKRIINAGIVRVVVRGLYQSQNTGLVPELLQTAGVAYEIRAE
jgi:dCMP deaminase